MGQGWWSKPQTSKERLTMTEILDRLKSAIESIDTQYHRLIILVNCEDSSKHEILCLMKQDHEVKLVNLNLELSSRLLEYSTKQRPLKVAEIMTNLVNESPSPVLLDKLDILFDPSLQIDPLALLQSLSRSKTIIAFWSGSLKDNKLYYAEPGYPEYRSYPVQDFVAIDAQPQDSF